MKHYLAIILIIIQFFAFGQENPIDAIEKSELDSLYVKALNNRFDLLLSSGWKYIEPNEYGQRILKLNVSDRYKFLTNDELIDMAIKKKKSIRVIRMTHKIIGADTIDINFGILNLTAKRKIHFNNGLRFKVANYALECKGTEGYIPDMRFVFDKKKQNWLLAEGRYVIQTDKKSVQHKNKPH